MSTYDLSRRTRATMAGVGIIGTVVFFLGAFSSNLPMYGDSLIDWSSWAAPAHRSDASHEIGILLLSYLLFLLFGVFVASLVSGESPSSQLFGRIALVAVAVKFAIEMTQISVLIVPTAQGSSGLDDSMAQFGTTLSILSLVPYALFLIACGLAALASQAFPRWLAWFTLFVGAMHISAMILALVGLSDTPAMYVFGYIWFTSIPGWPLVAGVALLVSTIRRQRRATELAPAPA